MRTDREAMIHFVLFVDFVDALAAVFSWKVHKIHEKHKKAIPTLRFPLGMGSFSRQN